MREKSSIENSSMENSSMGNGCMGGNNSMSFWIRFVFLAILTCLFFMSTIYNMISNMRNLRGRIQSVVFIGLGAVHYLATLVFLGFLACGQKGDRMQYAAALIVLACWVNFTTSLRFLMFGKLYNLGLYIRMLDQILLKIATFLSLYFCLLLGFTISFSILLPEKFTSPWLIPTTMVMMTGELDYEEKFGKAGSFIKAVVFIFIILVPIIINNLLIGLTINDVDILIKNANISGLEFKLRHIDMLDKSPMMRVLSWVASRTIAQSHLISAKDNSLEVTHHLVILSNYHAKVAIKLHDTQPNFLSSGCITSIFEV
jgi:hypothetical protein